MLDVETAVQRLINAAPETKSWVLSHVAVPAVAITLIVWLVGGGPTGVLDVDSNMSIVKLQTRVDGDGRASARNGVAIIFEPADGAYSLPLRFRHPPQAWTSLDAQAFAANTTRLRIGSGRVEADLPMLGATEPVLVIAEGESAGEVFLRNVRTPIDTFRLRPRQSVGLATWAMVGAMFCAALTLSSGVNRPAPREQG